MPITPPALEVTAYPTIGGAMNIARSRVDDMLNDVDGDLLTNDAPASQTYLTSAWEWYQEQCSEAGIETNRKNVFIFGVPGRASDDPAYPSWITWLGCSDGVNQFEQPVLPSEMIQPLTIWSRPSGSTGAFSDPWEMADNGLSPHLKRFEYSWERDGVYFYGDTAAMDMRVRIDAYLDDLDISKPTYRIPLTRCMNPLGTRVAFEFANARGSAQAAALEARADKEFSDGAKSRTSRRKQRATYRRQPYGGRGTQCGGTWPQYRNY